MMQDVVALRVARLQRRFERRGCTSALIAAISVALMAPAIGGAQPSTATQMTGPQTKAPAAHRTAANSKRNPARLKAAVAANPAQTPAPPPAPPKPQWPVNDPPRQAAVAWSAQGLSIEAQNSSLEQILNDIAAQSGVKIEGMEKDERVFGVYGPGQPRDVLSQLLEGTDYNVLMVGAGERGAPQQIVLSVKPAGGTQPNAPVSQGENYEPPVVPYEPPQAMPPQPPPQAMPPNQPPRTPQQILQEMQQRQLLMQQQQQMQHPPQQQQ